MAMSEEVQREYNNVLTQVIVEHGAIVVIYNPYFGWHDYIATRHIQQCGIASHGTPCEDSWDEFVDTFYEGDTTQYYRLLLLSTTTATMIIKISTVLFHL